MTAKRQRTDNDDSDDDVPFGKLYESKQAALSQYERERLAQIQVNTEFLTSLQLPTRPPPSTRPRKVAARRAPRVNAQPARVSSRISKMPAADYVTPQEIAQHEQKDDKSEAVELGYCSRAGKWRGERFGEVTNVPKGTVFGTVSRSCGSGLENKPDMAGRLSAAREEGNDDHRVLQALCNPRVDRPCRRVLCIDPKYVKMR